jgi:dienelactone hydrolase
MTVMRIVLPSGTEAAVAHPSTDPGTGVGVVIAPDIFGLRPLYDDMVERFARNWGIPAVAVEPFPGRGLGDDVGERMAAVSAIDDEAHLADLVAAADECGFERAMLIGFCMGGMYCFKAARSERFERIASFYGMIRLPAGWYGPGQVEPLEHLVAGHPERVLAVIGDLDPYTPLDDVVALAATGVHVVRYPEAEHGFAHDSNRPAHRPDDAADAFARAHDWLVTSV